MFSVVVEVEFGLVLLQSHCKQVIGLGSFKFLDEGANVLLLFPNVDESLPVRTVFGNSDVDGPPSRPVSVLASCDFVAADKAEGGSLLNELLEFVEVRNDVDEVASSPPILDLSISLLHFFLNG